MVWNTQMKGIVGIPRSEYQTTGPPNHQFTLSWNEYIPNKNDGPWMEHVIETASNIWQKFWVSMLVFGAVEMF